MLKKNIGRFEILQALGKGTSIVYKAVDPINGKTVAVKSLTGVRLNPDMSEEEVVDRFKREALATRRLNHSSIVKILEADCDTQGTPYIVMEYVPGDSLLRVIDLQSPLDPVLAIHYLAQLASAIDYAHSFGIVHRDIKPSNVLIGQDKTAYLLDFGLAHVGDSSLTPIGIVLGTPAYMSPEQIRGDKLHAGSDCFSFGVMAFETLTGQRPFPGEDFTSVVTNIMHLPPLGFASLTRKDLPSSLEPVLQKMLSKKSGERFADCQVFVDALGGCLGITVDASGVAGYNDGIKITDICDMPIPPVIEAPPPNPPKQNEGENQIVERKPTKTNIQTNFENPRNRMLEEAPEDPNQSLQFVLIGAVIAGVLLVIVGLFFVPSGATVGSPGLWDSFTSIFSSGSTKDSVKEREKVPPMADGQPAQTENAVHSAQPVPGESSSSESQVAVESFASLPDGSLAAILSVDNKDLNKVIAAVEEAAKRDYTTFAPILIQLAQHEDFRVRVAVIKAFASSDKFKTKEVFKVIVGALGDPHWSVRGFAVRIISGLNNKAALRLLEERQKIEDYPLVQRLISEGIAKIRESIAVP